MTETNRGHKRKTYRAVRCGVCKLKLEDPIEKCPMNQVPVCPECVNDVPESELVPR